MSMDNWFWCSYLGTVCFFVACTQDRGHFSDAQFAPGIRAIIGGDEVDILYVDPDPATNKLPELFVRLGSEEATALKDVTADDVQNREGFESIEKKLDGDRVVEVWGKRTEFIFREGTLLRASLDDVSPFAFSNKREGPFIKLPCKVEQFEAVFGKPRGKTDFPVLAP